MKRLIESGNGFRDLETTSQYEKERRRISLYSKVKHVSLILTLLSFIIAVTHMNIYRWALDLSHYTPNVELLFYILGLVPLFSVPVAVLNCAGLVFYNPFHRNEVSPSILPSVPFMCFRIVTKGDIPAFVTRNAIYNRELCHGFGLEQFIVEIVSDKPINCHDKDRIREIIVPESYRTKNGTLYKARALNYCLESNVNLLARNSWIVHLDEETLLTKESLSGIVHFVTSGKGDIGQGPISYGNGEIISNWITTLADSIRLANDYCLFRFQYAFLKRPVFGFRGSYIVVRNKVEMDIGLDNGPGGSVAEDCFFALKAWSENYKFEFITGEMHEISPFSIQDFIQQRRRWFVSQFFVMLSKEIPVKNKLGILWSLFCCLLMPISLSNIFIYIFCPFQRSLTICCLNGLVGGTFCFMYSFGTFLSCFKRNWSQLHLITVSIFCCTFIMPIAATMEFVAVYWGLFTLKSNHFFVVQKDFTRESEEMHHVKVL